MGARVRAGTVDKRGRCQAEAARAEEARGEPEPTECPQACRGSFSLLYVHFPSLYSSG